MEEHWGPGHLLLMHMDLFIRMPSPIQVGEMLLPNYFFYIAGVLVVLFLTIMSAGHSALYS